MSKDFLDEIFMLILFTLCFMFFSSFVCNPFIHFPFFALFSFCIFLIVSTVFDFISFEISYF